jgi:hypothetical protein
MNPPSENCNWARAPAAVLIESPALISDPLPSRCRMPFAETDTTFPIANSTRPAAMQYPVTGYAAEIVASNIAWWDNFNLKRF